MNETQRSAIVETWQLLALAFPDMHGSIKFNFKPGRDYANANIEQGLALEFDGGIIKNMSNRISKQKKKY